MLSIQNWVKFLFPNEILTYHLSDLNSETKDKKDPKKRIYFSIEKNSNCRQFCSLTTDQLDILFEHCPMSHRTLYESISPLNSVKAYMDFEYYTSHNSDLENEKISIECCLKVLYYLLNSEENSINIFGPNNENILKQFLVLEASTNEKISYHIIYAKPLFLFENIFSLKQFIKTTVEYLLLSVIKHKCTSFNIPEFASQPIASNLIQYLAPYINNIRRNCADCSSSIPNVSVGDIANLLIRDKSNHWSIVIDMNVYANNQQFRIFNSVKHGKNNPLLLSKNFPFDKYSQYSSLDILHLSLISFNSNNHVPIISYKKNQFQVNKTSNSLSQFDHRISEKICHINLLNEHLQNFQCIFRMKKKNHIIRNSSNSNLIPKHQITDLLDESIEVFTTFVENLIKSQPSHQGYIHSCIRGNYNRNILFFNIKGDYRYCPKQKRHHRSNSVAIMIDTIKKMYSIRCKDIECDNTIIEWKSILN